MDFDSVVVINPPSPVGYISNKDSMGGFGQLYPVGATYLPPLDMPYMISYLESKGHKVEVMECLGFEWDEEKLIQKIKNLKLPSLLLMRTSDPTLTYDITVAERIKENCSEHAISLYGPVVEHRCELAKKSDAFTFLFTGEANEAVSEVFSGTEPKNIPNLIYKNHSDGWKQTKIIPVNTDLDLLPFPAWHRMPHETYQIPKSSNMSRMKFLPVLASRGCPYACNYCPYPVAQGIKRRGRSFQNVVDEIEYLINEFGVNYVLFRDPVFSINQQWVKDLCAEIVKRNLKFSWKCETRFDCVDSDTIKAMLKAGCTGINFGIESTDPDIQRESGRRPITSEEILEKVAICKDFGINIFCFFIIGLPGDTFETILNTISFAIEISPDWAQFTAASPLTGTKLREWAISGGHFDEKDFNYINAHSVVMGNDNLTKNDLARILRFAKFIQNNLINRRGILKDKNRTGVIYRGLKSGVDWFFLWVAKTFFEFGKASFKKS